MKWIRALQRHLGWKLFLSYVLILIIGIVALDTAAELPLPFSATFDEHLIVATLVGLIAAIAASIFTTRRILQPIQAMMRASQRISAGDYHHRIAPPSQDELGALAESFNQMADTLDRTEHRRLELIGNVAHELRTPLASIKSNLEGLIDGVIPSEPATFLGLEREVSRMQRLVRDLEEMSRVEAGQIRLELKSVNLAELVGIVAEHLRSQFEDKSVTLRFDIPAGLPGVQADASRLTQVLLNLLGNALQYTPAEGTVTVRAWRERNVLSVAIQDTGIGIAPEHLPHLFERFYRVDKSRSRAGGGSGIGLTIAKHLIEMHGGHVSVASAGLGRGSTFTFTLPLAS